MGRISNSLLGAALALLLAAAPARATTYFVDGTAGSNGNAGTSWSVPFQTLAGALAATTPTVIAVGSTGSFTANAAITWTLPATQISIISSTNPGSGTTITPAGGAVESVGTPNSAFNVNCNNDQTKAYIFGMTLTSGSGGTSANVNLGQAAQGCSIQFDSGSIVLAGTSSNTINIASGGSSSGILFHSTGSAFSTTGGRTGSMFTIGSGIMEIVNPSLSFSGVPSTLFVSGSTSSFGNLTVRDGDLSAWTQAGGGIIGNFQHSRVLLKNLKINASSVPVASNAFSSGSSGEAYVRNVDSGNTLYKFQYSNLYGTSTVDVSNYMSGGVSFNGSPASWKIVTTSAATPQTPFCAPVVEAWNTTTSSQTLKIEFAQNASATALTDLQIWSTLDFPNSGSFPSYTLSSNRNAAPITGTGSNQPTSVASWTGLTTPTTQNLPITFTAAANGLLQGQVCVTAASTTLWMNPGLTQ